MLSTTPLTSTIYEQVFESATVRPLPDTEPILIDGFNTDRTLSFEELKTRARGLALALRRAPYNLNEGDVVAICSPNDVEYVIAIHGVMAAGCSASLIPNIITMPEIVGLFELAEPKAVIAHAETLDKVLLALQACSLQLPIWIIGPPSPSPFPTTDLAIAPLSDVSLKTFTEALPKVNPDTIAYFVCTSGSTGPRKLVTITQRIGVLRIQQMTKSFRDESADTRRLANNHFAYAISVAIQMAALVQLGSRQYIVESSELSSQLQLVERHRLNGVLFSPWAATYIAHHPKVLDGYDLSSLRVSGSAGQAIRADVQRLVMKNMHLESFVLYYGSTESFVPFVPIMGEPKEAAGRLSHEEGFHVKLVDEHGKEVPQGEEGELWVKHPLLAKGYHKDPVKTAEAFDEDGYYHSSDIFRMNDKEEFYFLGRKSDTIKTRYRYFSPRYIEDVMMSYDGIKECAAVGAFSNKHGFEFPRAYIVLHENVTSAKVSPEWVTAFIEYVNERVPEKGMRLDGGVQVLEELPRTSVGKINLFSLRALAQEAIEQEML